MTDQMWSWVLGIIGVAGFVLAGKKIWWAWYVNIAAQFAWFTYAVVTEQWGFFFSALVYFVVFSKNARDWTREHFAEKDEPEFNRNEIRFLVTDTEMPGLDPDFGRPQGLFSEPDTEFRSRGKFTIPSDVFLNAYGSDLEDEIWGYFREKTEELHADFTLMTTRDLDYDVVTVEWESSKPVRGVINPFKRAEVKPSGFTWRGDATESTVDKLGESDQGPVFFSYSEIEKAGHEGDIILLQKQLFKRAEELGCVVEMKYHHKPNGILVDWVWK